MKRLLRILAAVLALAPLSARPATPPALPGDSVYQLPAALTDASGKPVEWRELRGTPRVATMFYTSCKYICPLVVDSLRAIERKLSAAERARIGFVLISMDPARDTPEALARIIAERKLDPARWTLLQPDPADLRGLAGLLGIRYRSLADGEFNHSTSLVLLDAEGRVLARTDQLGADGDAAFLAAVRAAAASGTGSGR
ncbi:MAG TPA: SCO family protein [Steroidobacteraceae bacterium]|jgi:protein SCO1/2|nr:SCO family protein [Steroidobacteraceae bacterium]